jgi:hypothetical protein
MDDRISSREGVSMRIRPSVVSMIVSTAVIVLLGWPKGLPGQWKGRIVEEEGVKIVRNPKEPALADLVLKLEEELGLGREDDPNAAFSDVGGLEVDEAGNIYVLESRNCRVQVFDKNGKYLRTIGRKGQGPGEFEAAVRFFLSPSGLAVFGRRRLSYFDRDGDFLRSTTFKGEFAPGALFETGKSAAIAFTYDPQRYSYEVVIAGAEGSLEKTIEKFVPPKHTATLKGAPLGYFNIHVPRLFLNPIGPQAAVYGFAAAYKLKIIDPEGRTTKVILKNEAPESYTKKEKEDVLAAEAEGNSLPKGEIEKVYVFPEHKALFHGLFADDRGFIYVQRTPFAKKRLDWTFDVFDSEGRYIHRIVMPSYVWPYSLKIKKECLYSEITDPESGEIKVKRFRITNWGSTF